VKREKFNGRIVFARKIWIEYEAGGQRQPAPLKWLDSFAMRSFTNDSVFDDTLPRADGRMEIGARVPLDRLRQAMEDWFCRKGYLAKNMTLFTTEGTEDTEETKQQGPEPFRRRLTQRNADQIKTT